MEVRNLIVMVDDSADEAEFVRRALARRCPDAELRVFQRASDAVQYLTDPMSEGRDADVRLVLLDLKLPGLGGHAVLRELRAHHSPGRLPIVIFSSSREPSDVGEAYREGVNSYVVKPVVHEEYVELVGLVGRYWLDANHTERGGTGCAHG